MLDEHALSLIASAARMDTRQARAEMMAVLGEGESSAQMLRRAAWLCVVEREFWQACALLKRAQMDPQDRGEGFFAEGLLWLAVGKHELARCNFIAATYAYYPVGALRERKLAELSQYSPETNRMAVFSILYDVFDNAFCCFVALSHVREDEYQPYGFCISRTCSYLGHSKATADLLQEEFKLNGESLWYHINMGHFCWLNEERDAADIHFNAARSISMEKKITPYHVDCGALLWLNRAEAEKLLAPGPDVGKISIFDWKFVFPSVQSEKPKIVFLVGCDSNYFVFFPKFMLSVLRAKQMSGADIPVAVHCHVSDPEPDQLRFLQEAAAHLEDMGGSVILSYSTNRAQFRDASYYTCLRFLAAPRVLEHYERGALIMDIDSEIDTGFFTKLSEITAHDLGLRMYSFNDETRIQVAGEPWSIGAHPTYVAGSMVGQKFMRFIAKYVSAAYTPELVTNWTIDQCAIARAYDLLVRKNALVKVLNFAAFDTISHLPSDSKLAFLHEGGLVTTMNFWSRVEEITGSGEYV
ncbi:MAG: hypothetical protein P4L87_20930 [Formivibrio sp.]|nr:hypothetical protein [Formivibrio sp.]